MFGFELDRDEWAVATGAAYLALRVCCGLARIGWRYSIDAPLAFRINKYPPLATGIAVGAIAVGVTSIAPGGPRREFGVAIYPVVGVGGFFLGLILDVMLTMRLYRLSYWLASFRVPQYRDRLQSGDPAVRLLAAERLAGLGNHAQSACPELLVAMRDESADVRAASAVATLQANSDPPLEDDRDTPAVAHVVLTDPDFRVRTFAAAILVRFRASPAADVLPALTEGLARGDDGTAMIAVTTLGRLGPEAAPAIPELREAILLRKPPVWGATAALGAIGAPAVPLLIEILEIGELNSKWEAADALGKMGEPARQALPVLRRLAGSSLFGPAAKRAIRKLGGEVRELR